MSACCRQPLPSARVAVASLHQPESHKKAVALAVYDKIASDPARHS
jgi:hypothetical protein